MATRFLVACGDPAWGIALCDAVQARSGGDCTGSVCASGRAAEVARMLRPHVLLLQAPGQGAGLGELLPRVHAACAQMRVLLLCDACSRELLVEALEHGVHGFLPERGEADLYARALTVVQQGGLWFSRAMLLEALRTVHAPGMLAVAEEGKLTQREEQILGLIGSGLTNKEIGRRLAISDQTVKTHLHRVYVKLRRSGRHKVLLVPGDADLPPMQRPRPAAGGAGAAGA